MKTVVKENEKEQLYSLVLLNFALVKQNTSEFESSSYLFFAASALAIPTDS